MYAVKEIFHTLQGEGANAGRAAVFCRFAGCNLWSGREVDRATAACRFCDTDFVGGARYGLTELVDAICAAGAGMVVLTGGEPMLQVDGPLIDELHARGRVIAIETNGTLDVPREIDWICVSPKAGVEIRQRTGNELKVVVPQSLNLRAMEAWLFDHRFVQPMAGREGSDAWAIAWCLANPAWRLSVQTHKMIGLR